MWQCREMAGPCLCQDPSLHSSINSSRRTEQFLRLTSDTLADLHLLQRNPWEGTLQLALDCSFHLLCCLFQWRGKGWSSDWSHLECHRCLPPAVSQPLEDLGVLKHPDLCFFPWVTLKLTELSSPCLCASCSVHVAIIVVQSAALAFLLHLCLVPFHVDAQYTPFQRRTGRRGLFVVLTVRAPDCLALVSFLLTMLKRIIHSDAFQWMIALKISSEPSVETY